ncbi:MAG: cytochrome c [Candidatus Eremiobacteraeota bacterium]|nr:cytochrome c [Candidatus Eremiobacteraeota bacterium]
MKKVALLLIILSSLCLAQEVSPDGQQLFKLHCQTCHGALGKGDGPAAQALVPPPRDLTQRPYKQGCGPGAIVNTLQTGVPNSAMPSFSKTLSEDEMWALSRYVRNLQQGCCER